MAWFLKQVMLLIILENENQDFLLNSLSCKMRTTANFDKVLEDKINCRIIGNKEVDFLVYKTHMISLGKSRIVRTADIMINVSSR